MKTLLFFLLTGWMVFAAWAGEPTAKSLKKCPNGHATLKNVRIVYGLPPWEGAAAEEWRKAVENLEIVSGGCESDPESPKYEVICTTCRFAHSIFSTATPEDGWWTGDSPDAGSFPKPISDLAKSFPAPHQSQLKEPVSFSQTLNDRMEVRYDGVSFYATTPTDVLKSEIDEWLKANAIECRFTSQTHTRAVDGKKCDTLEWETAGLSVSIRVQHEHSDGVSWIHATFYKQSQTPPES